jgi:hypothetical protein
MTADVSVLLDEGLLARGYAVERTQENPESFGSWYRDYVRGEQRVRLIWDGRDQWFVLQGGKEWHDLAIRRPADLVGGALHEFLTHAD